MHILIVTAHLPYPLVLGGQVGTFQLIRGLSKAHQITILFPTYSPDDERSVAELHKLLPNVEIIPYTSSLRSTHSKAKTIEKAIRKWVGQTKEWTGVRMVKGLFFPDSFVSIQSEVLKQHILSRVHAGQVDIIQIDFPWMMGVVNDVPPSIPSIYVEHEIPFIIALRHFRSAETPIEKWLWRKRQYYYKKQEVALGQKYHAIITLTEVDKCILQRVLPDKPIFVSPLGIDTFYYQPTREDHNYGKIAFMGSWKHYPNVDGLKFFFKHIFPIIKVDKPDVRMFILGDFNGIDKRALSSEPSVIWTGFVEDTRPYLEGSVFIAPLRIGSGLRMKILEAMSMGCPVVSTSVGCEGIPARDGEDIFVEDDPGNFARRILYLMENPKQATEVGQNGRKMVVREYNYENVAKIREKIYQQVLAEFDAN